MRRVLVTGASGYVARHLIEALTADGGTTVLALSRTPDILPVRPGIERVQGSVLDPESYASLLPSVDTVVHLAAATGKAKSEVFEKVNVEGTQGLVAASVEAGVRSFLHVSTVAVRYPNADRYPYADSKRRAEALVRDSGLSYTILRPTIVLGKGSAAGQSFATLVRPSLILVPGPGTVAIQPIDVKDLAAVLAAVIRSERFAGETLTVGGPEAVSIETFLRRAHAVCHGGTPRVVNLPLGVLLPMLRLGEQMAFAFVPATAGQFSAFQYDSAVDDSGHPDAFSASFQPLSAMLAECCA